jgi:hypothetical protein
MLAEALVNEWRDAAHKNAEVIHDSATVLFSLAEINLTLAHVARRITESTLRALFRDVIDEIDRMCTEIASRYTPRPNLQEYLHAVKLKHTQLLDPTQSRRHHAN